MDGRRASPPVRWFVFDAGALSHVDATGMRALKDLVGERNVYPTVRAAVDEAPVGIELGQLLARLGCPAARLRRVRTRTPCLTA
jgi:hypothetical protein